MAKRPYVDFAEVKRTVTLPEVIEVFGIAEQFFRNGDKLHGVCPLPMHRHGPSPNSDQFKADLRNDLWLWHCFGDCQRGGDVIEFVKLMTGYDDSHVRFWFADKFGSRLTLGKGKSGRQVKKEAAHSDGPKASPQTAAVPMTNLPDDASLLKPLKFFLNLDPNVPYLKDRGITEETVRRYGLGLCSKGLLNGYVAMPVHRHTDFQVVAYLGRWPGEDYDEGPGRPRYKWPKDFPKSQVVFGLKQALEADPDGSTLIVVEGPFSVFHLAQQGFPNAVAIFGSSLSEEQAAILASTSRKLWLLFDGDEAGQVGMRVAAGKLITRSFVRATKLAANIQPDSLSRPQLTSFLS